VREIARYLTERGVRVWVVTASPEVTVRVAMRYFGYTGRLIGLRNRVTNGVMTDVLEEPLSVQEGKVACIKRYIDSSARPVVAIGDSMNDLPMLEYARVPIVVDTGSALASLARERGWALV
jgi:phosphoserine phosphatase